MAGKEFNLKQSTKEVRKIYNDAEALINSKITGYEIAQNTSVDINTVYQIRRGELLLERTRYTTMSELHRYYKKVEPRIKQGG